MPIEVADGRVIKMQECKSERSDAGVRGRE